MEGYPADEILKAAKEQACDAIIMGAHKKGVTSYTYLGSVTQRVLQRVRKPVFVIPLPEGKADDIFRDFEELF
jgi:nucleotide-binding universal stress UspA family protein